MNDSTDTAPRGDSRPRGLYVQWVVVAIAAVAAVSLGMHGFREYYRAANPPFSYMTLLYAALQLFTMSSGAVPGVDLPWHLDVARFAAPLVLGYGVVLSVATAFWQQLGDMRMRRRKNHTVVCGLGRKGMQLVKDFRAAGEEVVVIQREDDTQHTSACSSLGAKVMLGDATCAPLLQRAAVNQARRVIAVSGDDGVNAEIMLATQSLLPRKATRPALFAHVVDVGLARFLGVRAAEELPRPRIINMYESAARLLLWEHPLEHDLRNAQDERTVHLVLVGCGQMGEAVILQAAKIGHYINGKRLRVTAIDLAAARKEERLLGRYPNLREVCDVAFTEADIEHASTLRMICERMSPASTISTVVLSLDNDARNLSLADALRGTSGYSDTPILIRASKKTGLASLIHAGTGTAATLGAFGFVDRICSRAALLQEDLDALAKAIHEDFRRGEKGRRPDSDLSMKEWDVLNGTFQDSNRQQADHMLVKLRAAGYGSPAEVQLDGGKRLDDRKEELAKMEHARWSAERWLAGWRLGEQKDLDRKLSPHLKPWDQLAEEVRQYDRDTVTRIPMILKSADGTKWSQWLEENMKAPETQA